MSGKRDFTLLKVTQDMQVMEEKSNEKAREDMTEWERIMIGLSKKMEMVEREEVKEKKRVKRVYKKYKNYKVLPDRDGDAFVTLDDLAERKVLNETYPPLSKQKSSTKKRKKKFRRIHSSPPLNRRRRYYTRYKKRVQSQPILLERSSSNEKEEKEPYEFLRRSKSSSNALRFAHSSRSKRFTSPYLRKMKLQNIREKLMKWNAGYPSYDQSGIRLNTLERELFRPKKRNSLPVVLVNSEQVTHPSTPPPKKVTMKKKKRNKRFKSAPIMKMKRKSSRRKGRNVKKKRSRKLISKRSRRREETEKIEDATTSQRTTSTQTKLETRKPEKKKLARRKRISKPKKAEENEKSIDDIECDFYDDSLRIRRSQELTKEQKEDDLELSEIEMKSSDDEEEEEMEEFEEISEEVPKIDSFKDFDVNSFVEESLAELSNKEKNGEATEKEEEDSEGDRTLTELKILETEMNYISSLLSFREFIEFLQKKMSKESRRKVFSGYLDISNFHIHVLSNELQKTSFPNIIELFSRNCEELTRCYVVYFINYSTIIESWKNELAINEELKVHVEEFESGNFHSGQYDGEKRSQEEEEEGSNKKERMTMMEMFGLPASRIGEYRDMFKKLSRFVGVKNTDCEKLKTIVSAFESLQEQKELFFET